MYHEIYEELAGVIGEEEMLKLYRIYGGLSVNFPVKLYSREYAREYIREHMDMEPKKLAKELGLGERRIRQIKQELRSEETLA